MGETNIPNEIELEQDDSSFPLPKLISNAYLPIGALFVRLSVIIVELDIFGCRVSSLRLKE